MENFRDTCPAGVYQTEIQILPEHTDVAGNVTLGALARMMQQVTEAHMDEAGLGYQQLRERGMLWFIVWTSIQIEELPKQGESYIIRTWPGEVKLGMYARRYAFYTKDGKELIKTSSLFMMIAEETRKMISPKELPGQLAEVVVEEQIELPKQRVKFPELLLLQFHTVAEHEIDKNGHVNNAYYMDWVYELLNPAYIQKHPLKSCWMQYNKELMQGQKAEIQYGLQENAFFVKGVAEDEISFQVKMEFED